MILLLAHFLFGIVTQYRENYTPSPEFGTVAGLISQRNDAVANNTSESSQNPINYLFLTPSLNFHGAKIWSKTV